MYYSHQLDAENFIGYEDKSLTAKMQAQYTDVILLVSVCSLVQPTLSLSGIRTSGKMQVRCYISASIVITSIF